MRALRIGWAVLAAALLCAPSASAQAAACTEDVVLRTADCPAGTTNCTTKDATLTWVELDATLANVAGLCSERDANAFLAGPTTGADDRPIWRALVAADIPTPLTSSTSGNAATATALAANPSDCAANQFATTIAASGNLTCSPIIAADLPVTITSNTSGNAATATALAANGTNCSAGQSPRGVDASGNAESCAVYGDVVGPSSATDSAVALYDGTTGKLTKNSDLTVPAASKLAFGSSGMWDVTTGNFEARNSGDTDWTQVRSVGWEIYQTADISQRVAYCYGVSPFKSCGFSSDFELTFSDTTSTAGGNTKVTRPAAGVVRITSILELPPTDSPVACVDARRGDIYFDDSLGEHCACRGASGAAAWLQMDGGGAC